MSRLEVVTERRQSINGMLTEAAPSSELIVQRHGRATVRVWDNRHGRSMPTRKR